MVQVSAIPPARAAPPKLLLLLLRTTTQRVLESPNPAWLFPLRVLRRDADPARFVGICRRTNTPFGLDAVLAHPCDARGVVPPFLYALTMERVMLVPDKCLPLEPRVAFPFLVDFSHDL